MKRREFMAAALAAPLGAKMARAGAGRRILVIGAGLAGLSAARDLAAMGHHVTVIEARDRLGGRIHTSRLWPDLPMDLGASWIHGTKGNPLTALADGIGAARVATSYDSSLMLGPNGGDIAPDMAGAEKILKAAWRWAETREADVSIQKAVEATKGWQAADGGQRRLVQHLINATLEQEYGGAAAALSAWHGDSAAEFDGEDVIFPAGFSELVKALAKGLDIRLNQPVTRVALGRVTLADGQTVMADQILVTAPLGVLQAGRIEFAQPLNPARLNAINGLRMGLLNKTWLRFDRVAWPADVDWFEWLGPKPGQWAEWLSLVQGLGVPVLLGFNAADQAAELEALSDATILQSATEALRAMFGTGFPAPIAAQITRWGQDPWALGSYSFNAVGTSPDTRSDLSGADWEGALWFAGEACEPDYFGTAHGAVLSGRAVAKAMG